MKDNKKRDKKKQDSNRLILDNILNSESPEIKQFMKNAMKEEMGKVNPSTPEGGVESMERAATEVFDRVLIRMAWRFKDKLSPHMQRVLEEQYPDLDVA